MSQAQSRTMIFGAMARAFALVSQFFVFIVLAKVLSKTAFGDAMTAFALFRLVSSGIGTGLGTVLLYHLPRTPEDAQLDLQRFTFALGAVVSLAFSLAAALFASPIAALLNKPDLVFWLVSLAPIGVAGTLMTISGMAFDANLRITRSILLVEVLPNAIRLLLFPLAAFSNQPHYWVGAVFTISLVLPLAWPVAGLLITGKIGWRPWTAWDARYGANFTLYAILSSQSMGIDMLVVGWLFDSASAGDYGVAIRLATLFPFFQLILIRRFAPKAAYLIARSDFSTLQREIDINRRLSISMVCTTVAGILIAAPFVLDRLPGYQSAFNLLVLLAAPAIIRAFFAGGERLLAMNGQSTLSLVIMTASAAMLVGVPAAAHQWLGVKAVPFALLLSAGLLNPLIAWGCRRGLGIRLLGRQDIIPAFGALAAILLLLRADAASNPATIAMGAAILLASGLAALFPFAHFYRLK